MRLPSGLGWWILLLVLGVAGCGAEDKLARGRTAAEGYLEAVKQKNPNKAMTFFAKGYFETRSPAGWRADFRLILARLGALRSFSLTRWSWRTDFVPPDSGIYLSLEYEVTYAKHKAAETFVVFKPFTRREYRIVGYTIASEGLLAK